MFRRLSLGLIALFLLAPLTAQAGSTPVPAQASATAAPATPQISTPPQQPALPETLNNLALKGAQIRYLGRAQGLDGWIVVQNGQEQYFYATPDREAILLGLLFDKHGKLITVQQVKNLQAGHDPTIDSLLSTPTEAQAEDPIKALQKQLEQQQQTKAQSPAEKLYADVEKSNYVTLGDDKAPYIYAFLDPQCPHCADFMKDARKDYIDAGLLQVRMVAVGFNDETKSQAAYLLASPNPKQAWYDHLDAKKLLPVSSDVNKQAVEANVAIMQNWKLDATPIIVYRSNKGEIKIVRGRPRSLNDILNDLK